MALLSAERHKREDIKAELRKRHGAVTRFEIARGLPKDSARDVLRGRANRDVAEVIAAELNTTIHELFPGRYSSRYRDNSDDSQITHRQISGDK